MERERANEMGSIALQPSKAIMNTVVVQTKKIRIGRAEKERQIEVNVN